jgi:hypothetical protein
MNSKWLWGIVASLIVAGIGNSTATGIRNESRISKIEARDEVEREASKEYRKQAREDAKEIRDDVKEVVKSTTETQAMVRSLLTKK